MKRIAVFGKPGGGKSTLSKKLSSITGIPLIPLDLIQYEKNGDQVSREVYSKKHAELIAADEWIIDGLGTLKSFWLRIDSADTLIYIDLPYHVHYWWINKRLLKSLFVKPEGWPDGSSVLKGTIAGWKYLRQSPAFWTPELITEIQQRANGKTLIKITSIKELNTFTDHFRDD